MEISKKRRKWILFTLVVMTICCFLPAFLLTYDSFIYPKWVNMISPHPQQVRFSEPRLIAEDLMDVYKLTWSEDGSRIEVYEGHWTLAAPDEPGTIKVFDVHTGDLVDMYKEGDTPDQEIFVCPDKNIAIEFKDIDGHKWSISLMRDNKKINEFLFSPIHKGEYEGSRVPSSASFSPKCNYLTFIVDGWIYHEGEGPPELWLLDIYNAILRPIVIGRWPVVRLWDYPVQSVQPDWSPDENEIIFGDSEFGIEIYNIRTMKRRWLVGPGSADLEPKWSHNGKWIASWQPGADQNAAYDSILLMSTDGRTKVVTGQCSFSGNMEWSPNDNLLAYLCPGAQGNYSLWVWTTDETASK
jgi:WD40 repeat protein